MYRHSLRLLTNVTTKKTQVDVTLGKYVQSVNRPELLGDIQEYIQSKAKFDELITKYDIFTIKQKTTAYAANTVGLQLPKTYKE